MTCEEKVHILQQNTLIPGEDSSVYTGQAHETPHFVFAESSFVTAVRLLTRLLLAVLQQNRQRRWRMKQRRPAVTEPRKTPVEQRESIEFRRLGLNSIWQEFGCLKSELVKKTYRSLVCIFRLCQVKSALFFSSHLK